MKTQYLCNYLFLLRNNQIYITLGALLLADSLSVESLCVNPVCNLSHLFKTRPAISA